MKAALAIHNLGPKGLTYVHERIITLRAEASGRKQWELCELLGSVPPEHVLGVDAQDQQRPRQHRFV